MQKALPGVMHPIPTSRPPGPPTKRRRRLVPALGLALFATTAWAGAASYYILFRDEVLGGFFAQVRTVELSYHQQLAALRLQVDQTISERVRSREGFEGRLGALAERQALIEQRQGMLSSLGASDPATTGSIAATPGAATARPRKPFPTPDPSGTDAEPGWGLRGDRVEVPERRLGVALAGLGDRLDRSSLRQSEMLGAIGARAAARAERLRGVIRRAGLEPGRFETSERGVGGPLVPLAGDAFERALAETRRATDEEHRLRRTLAALPLRRPLSEDAAFTSSFGARLDPFTRGLALHTGVDMRADRGTAAWATAAGRVTVAEYNGGYGNMVEVDHGHGIATRYAHLASVSVTPGQRVEAGAVVGRVGSTGRSTGNHLHYEVRIDGEPVDPMRFLASGAALGAELGDERSEADAAPAAFQSMSSTASSVP